PCLRGQSFLPSGSAAYAIALGGLEAPRQGCALTRWSRDTIWPFDWRPATRSGELLIEPIEHRLLRASTGADVAVRPGAVLSGQYNVPIRAREIRDEQLGLIDDEDYSAAAARWGPK
ncbi:MAG: hypothetical protein ACLQJR_25580, partial [Stellaceae bacterium]